MIQMNDVVARLSEIDAAAQQIVDQAAGKKKELNSKSLEERKTFDQELESKTKETLEELSDRLEEKNRQRLEDMKAENEKALKELEQTYQSNHAQLAEELFKKVIEVS